MKYDEFVGQVQHGAKLASRGEAVKAIRATLETLSERLSGGEPKDLASQLPEEIGIYLRHTLEGLSQPFSLQEFYLRVSLRAHVPVPRAIHQARSVMAVLQTAVSQGEIDDVRKQLPAQFHELFTQPGQPSAGAEKHPRIADIETRHPRVISPDASLIEAAKLMKECDIGMLPVCRGDKLIGTLTDRDITIRATAQGRDPRTTKVRDAMTPEVLYCHEQQDIQEAVRLMEENQIRRLPVIDKNKRLVGIVSLGDLAVRTHNDRLSGEVLERVCENHSSITPAQAH